MNDFQILLSLAASLLNWKTVFLFSFCTIFLHIFIINSLTINCTKTTKHHINHNDKRKVMTKKLLKWCHSLFNNIEAKKKSKIKGKSIFVKGIVKKHEMKLKTHNLTYLARLQVFTEKWYESAVMRLAGGASLSI